MGGERSGKGGYWREGGECPDEQHGSLLLYALHFPYIPSLLLFDSGWHVVGLFGVTAFAELRGAGKMRAGVGLEG